MELNNGTQQHPLRMRDSGRPGELSRYTAYMERMAKGIHEVISAMDELNDQFSPEATCPVLMAAAVPDGSFRLISSTETEQYVPGFGTSDEMEQIRSLNLLVSFQEKDAVRTEDAVYICGPVIFFNLDENGQELSLESSDIYHIQKYMEIHQVDIQNQSKSIPALHFAL